MTLSSAISIMDAFRSRPDRPTDLWTSEVVVAHQSGLPATRKPILRALGKARRSAEGRMLSSVARRLVEEARRLLKHHSSARANPGPAATFPTLCSRPLPSNVSVHWEWSVLPLHQLSPWTRSRGLHHLTVVMSLSAALRPGAVDQLEVAASPPLLGWSCCALHQLCYAGGGLLVARLRDFRR